MLHEALKVVVGSIQKCELKGLLCRLRKCLNVIAYRFLYINSVLFLETVTCKQSDMMLRWRELF